MANQERLQAFSTSSSAKRRVDAAVRSAHVRLSQHESGPVDRRAHAYSAPRSIARGTGSLQAGGPSHETGRFMAEFTIYLGNKNYSSWSLRPWLVLKQIGVAFDEVVIP